MYKLRNIAAGWWYDFFKDPRTEALALERGKHCETCPEARIGKWEIIKGGDLSVEMGLVCNGCPTKIKCPLRAKLRSPREKCPKNLW